MELKVTNGSTKLIRSTGFNRTFMELKVKIFRNVGRGATGFNRTFMELKGLNITYNTSRQRF